MQNDKIVNQSVRRRSLLLIVMIVLVTLFWVLMLVYTNLPTLVLGLIAVVSLLLLSVATAWTVTALPRRDKQSDAS